MVGEAQQWDAGFLHRSPIFAPLAEVAEPLAGQSDWPDLAQLADLFSRAGLSVRPVAQAGRPGRFEAHYEPRIYLKGELQTRSRNWHDLFNALVWLRFPRTKTELNRQHFRAAADRDHGSNRSPVENVLTRFDECGAVLISSEAMLLDLVRDHRWAELFVERREVFRAELRCFVFGHATFEKALDPYVGMTTNTLLVEDADLLSAPWEDLDQALATIWRGTDAGGPPRLHPFPVLGVPGWYAPNAEPDFYQNMDYFRPARRAAR